MDPTMAESNDKLSNTARVTRFMTALTAKDTKAALKELGSAKYIKEQGLGDIRLPDQHEFAEALDSGSDAIRALIEKCGFQGCPEEYITPVEIVRDKATARVRSIFKNFRFLGAVLDRHEATIHRRWLKRSNKQRLKVILEAWGTKMAVPHRPDFEAIELESEDDRVEGTAYRDSYLWPYINQEDLCKPQSLLLLMSTRARCHPSALAATEHEAHRMGERLMCFNYRSSGRYLMDLVSGGDEDCYGKLWSEQSHPEKRATLVKRNYAEPSWGLLVLEAQERVLSFLVNCAKLLLHDFTEDSILLSPPSQIVSPFAAKTDVGYASWATIAAEAPYRQPANLDLERIAALLATKYDEAADHLWALREDPSYFETHMLDSKEHRLEIIPDYNGRQHPICFPGQENKFWGRVVGHQVYRAHFKLEMFDDLRAQSKRLSELQNTYTDVLSASNFPEPYTQALQQFRYHLCEAARDLSVELFDAWCASPPLRIYHTRTVETDPNAHVDVVQLSSAFKDDKTRARIHWLLSRMWKGDELFGLIGLTHIVDELQHLVDSEEAKHCISPYVALLLGEIALVSALIRQLELYQPWAVMHGNVSSREQMAQLSFVFMLRSKDTLSLYLGIAKQDRVLGSLGAPTKGKFAYPVGKRRTRENVKAMRSAEEKLDKFWLKVDQDIKSKACKFWKKVHERAGSSAPEHVELEANPLKSSATHRLLTQGRTLQRTSPWTEPEPESGSDQTSVSELYVPFSQLSFDDQKSQKQTLRDSSSHSTKKQKTKTRKPDNPGTSVPEAEAASSVDSSQAVPKFVVDARALKVFKTLFFTPSVTSTPGELAWTDFLYAMVSMGFVPEKLYGSVWQFSPDPDKLAVERSIQFHEPHGANTKIPYCIARRHGRRLNRAYGWDGSSFTLEGKTKQ